MRMSDILNYMKGREDVTGKQYFFKVINFNRFTATLDIYEKDGDKLTFLKRQTVDH